MATLMVFIAIGLAACGQVSALALNQIRTSEFHVEGEKLYLNGEINSKSLEQFEGIIASNPQIRTLVELEVPGSLDDDTMIRLGYRVQELGLNTHLTAKSKIYSGGVICFLPDTRVQSNRGPKFGCIPGLTDGATPPIIPDPHRNMT